MSVSRQELVRHYSAAVRSGDAAMFLGAGMSRSAGFVDWRELLKQIASDLGLDIDRETDLVAVAQFHLNEKRNRSLLNNAIVHQFTKRAEATENHRIIARLPLSVIWTTNYDTLIEEAIKAAGKVADVKTTHANLAQNRPGKDIVVCKMHGDMMQPQDAILTKDDYEFYESTHRLFAEGLKGDLVSKTFLFLGFSFTDPNIDFVLSRVRILLGKNQGTHYCVMRRPQRPKQRGPKLAEYEYEKRKLELRVEDLRRFGIETLLIDKYSEITEILQDISKLAHQRNIFVSGSARAFEPLGEERLLGFARRLGTEIIARDYNLVSGFGFGLGEQVILGVLDGLYRASKGNDRGRVIIRPFPRVAEANQEEANDLHRWDLISQAGISVFLSGNREYEGKIGPSKSVWREYQITRKLERFPIPVGCTGYAAEAIWKDVDQKAPLIFRKMAVSRDLNVLGDSGKSEDALINAIFSIADKVSSFA